MEAAAAGAVGPRWFVAVAQNAGRGRSGRVWESPQGNLFATLLLTDPCPTRDLPKLGFVAGVALRTAVMALAPGLAGVALKWPNDLLVSGAKVAGVLLEARTQADGRCSVAIGIGVNCAYHPIGLPYPVTDFGEAGAPMTPADLLSALSDALADTLATFSAADGFRSVRALWLAGAHGVGHPIETRLAGAVRRGVFDGIDEHGRLLLREQAGVRAIDAADLFFSSGTTPNSPDRGAVGRR